MIRFLVFAFCLLAFEAQAAAPVASVTASRTTGTAPVCVVFDATATTDADTSKPFHDLLYRWNFGDSSAGAWAYGANTALSKNAATGPVAAHCYETAGTYTATVQACDATSCSTDTETITVTAANTTFSANTMCVANGTTPVAGAGGCPSGSTVRNSDDWDATLAAAFGANGCGTGVVCKRILFKRGDTFTASASGTVNVAGPGIVGAYGTGAKPIVLLAAGVRAIEFGATGTDWRIMDIDCNGQGNATTRCVASNAATSKITVLRITARNLNNPVGLSVAGTTEVFVQDSVISGQSGDGGNAIFYAGSKLGILGNSLTDSTNNGEHIVRISSCQLCVVANNTMAAPDATKVALKIHGEASVFVTATSTNGSPTLTSVTPDPANIVTGARIKTGTLEFLGAGVASTLNVQAFDLAANTITMTGNATASGTGTVELKIWDGSTYTENVVVADNKMQDSAAGVNWLAAIAPQNDTSDERLRNILLERNLFDANTSATSAIRLSAQYVSVRNNLVVQTWNGGINLAGADRTGIEPLSSELYVSNNTLYSASNSGDVRGFQFSSAATNVTLRNNLVYAPAATGDFYAGSAGTGLTDQTNSSDVEITSTSPQFTGPLTVPLGFAPTVASYATEGGTADFPATASDFFGCFDKTGDNRLGAIVPRAQAQCRGVAGP